MIKMKKSVEKLLHFLIPSAVVVVHALLGLVAAQKGYNICDVQECNCTVPAGAWKNVNCTLSYNQDLRLESGHIPKEVTEIVLRGGRTIRFAPKTFHNHKALALLRLETVNQVIIEKRAFCNVQSTSLLVQVLGCDDVMFKSYAFDDMQGSLSMEVLGTRHVRLEEAIFSKLSNATFQDVQEMRVDSGAFEIKNLGIHLRHGPESVVLFVNVFLPEIPNGVFKTSLAQILFKDCRIGTIRAEAFKASQISAMYILNTSIDTFGSSALTERTLVVDFTIIKCGIRKIQTGAVTAGMGNLTVNHSNITDIESRSIVSTAAKVEIVGNDIVNFHSNAIMIEKWTRITIDQNVIRNLHSDFIVTSSGVDVEWFRFKSNEIYNAMPGALSFVQKIDDGKMVLDDNFFSQSCGCDMPEWLDQLTNSTSKTDLLMDNSFCPVDEILSRCFSLPVGIINMRNFSEITCNNNTVCEPYNGETRTINTTGKIILDQDNNNKQNWLIFIMVLIGFFIIALISTFIALLVRGSRWLKRYFRNNYYNNRSNEDEENTIVTVDTENEKLEIPEELTVEFLHELSKRLDDPVTHQEASEMIERLYEMFIIDESYENNNREEEAHLYEELGNLSLQIPPPPYEEQPPPQQNPPQASPRGILKLMEEKFGNAPSNETQPVEESIKKSNSRPVLTSDYSEPIDKDDVHLYSELKQKDETKKGNGVNSNGSITMRPLPDKPGYLFQPGPSSIKS
ncbi:hypothetical protein ABEB36_000846 [Hypothenemus hampei]|uniref:Uncharacterized protein n=1 Tax=Hypothenemus hampei TaxID=57062 RepID=A0ABD1FCN7_HYPHA